MDVLLTVFLLCVQPPSEIGSFTLRSISKVCKLWHSLAFSYSPLWSNIYCTEFVPSSEWLDVQLSMCRTVPLDVVAVSTRCLEVLREFEKVGQMKSLKLMLRDTWRPCLLGQLFCTPAYELEVLDLEICPTSGLLPHMFIDDSTSFEGIMPKLRELRLCRIPFDFGTKFGSLFISTLRSLRTLKLECPYLFKATSWMHGLRDLKRLEHLTLLMGKDKKGLRYTQPAQLPYKTALPITLPRLRELVIQSTISDSMDFISYLTIASSCSVTLECVDVSPITDFEVLPERAISKLLDSNASVSRESLYAFETRLTTYGIFVIFIRLGPSLGQIVRHKLDIHFHQASSYRHSFSAFQPLFSKLCLHAIPKSLYIDLAATSDFIRPSLQIDHYRCAMLQWNPDIHQWLDLVCSMTGLQSVGLKLPEVYQSGWGQTKAIHVPQKREGQGSHPIVEVVGLDIFELNAPAILCDAILAQIVKPKGCGLKVVRIDRTNEDIGCFQAAVTRHLITEKEPFRFGALFLLNVVRVFLLPISSKTAKHEFHFVQENTSSTKWIDSVVTFCRAICTKCDVVVFKTNFPPMVKNKNGDVVRSIFGVKDRTEVVLDD